MTLAPAAQAPQILTPFQLGSRSHSLSLAGGAIWTLAATGQVYVNGKPQTGGNNTLALALVGTTMWGLSAINSKWYIWNGVSWALQAGLPVGVNSPSLMLDPDLGLLASASGTTQTDVSMLICLQGLRRLPWGEGTGA